MPPEIFIGTDIVEILRIRELIDVHPKRFLQHTYTDQEQLYCAGKSNSFIHYAVWNGNLFPDYFFNEI